MNAKKAVFGFVAGALAVLVFHQLMVLVLHLMGYIPNFPWSLRPIAPFGVPAIINQMFWGGLWGVGFAFLASRIPLASDVAKGTLYGVLGPWLLGNGILVPLFKGGPYLFGLMPMRMIIGALIGAAFGAGVGLLWSALKGR